MKDASFSLQSGISGFSWARQVSFYLLVALVFGGQLLALIYFLPPLINQLNERRRTVGQLTSEVRVLDKAVATLSSVDATKTHNDLAKATLALPDEKKISGIVSGMAALASSSGVALGGLEFNPGPIASQAGDLLRRPAADTTGMGSLRATPGSLSLVTSLQAFVGFLSQIYQVSQIVGVSGVGFSHDSSSGAAGSASLSLQIYYLPPPTGDVDWAGVRPLTASEQKLVDALSGTDVFIVPKESH